jgi:hypothetical protein
VGGTIARSSTEGIPLFRIFEVTKGGTLTLKGVTVSGGRLDGANGGGIFIAG